MAALGRVKSTLGELVPIGARRLLPRVPLLPLVLLSFHLCLELFDKLFVAFRVCIHGLHHFWVQLALVHVDTVDEIVSVPVSKFATASGSSLGIHEGIAGHLSLLDLLCDGLERLSLVAGEVERSSVFGCTSHLEWHVELTVRKVLGLIRLVLVLIVVLLDHFNFRL